MDCEYMKVSIIESMFKAFFVVGMHLQRSVRIALYRLRSTKPRDYEPIEPKGRGSKQWRFEVTRLSCEQGSNIFEKSHRQKIHNAHLQAGAENGNAASSYAATKKQRRPYAFTKKPTTNKLASWLESRPREAPNNKPPRERFFRGDQGTRAP